MEITVDLHRGTSSGAGTEEEAERRNSRPPNLNMPAPPDSSSLTKTSAPAVHRALRGAGAAPRIESSTSRQVTFPKRRHSGLFKKKPTSSPFSAKRRWWSSSSPPLTGCTTMRGRACWTRWNATGSAIPSALRRPTFSWGKAERRGDMEVSTYNSVSSILTHLRSYMIGENLSSLSLSDLQMVEINLGFALNKITARKERFLHLQEENEFLRRKVAELAAISSDPEKTSSTKGTACSGTIAECNAMTNCQAAHTSEDDCHDVTTLKLGL